MRPHFDPRRRTGPQPFRLVVLASATALAGCAGGRPPPVETARGPHVPAYNRPYQVRGRWYAPRAQPGYDAVGVASWYSYEAPSRRTADGEPFDIRVASAAHTTLPIPSWLEVTNLDNGRRARVRLNDRGPFVSGRLLDVSRAAAVELGFVQQGTARVRVRYLGPATTLGGPSMWAAAEPRPPAPAVVAPLRTASYALTAAPVVSAALDPRAEVAADAALPVDEPTPPGDPAPAAAPISEPASAGFEVQVAAFADRGNAERAAGRLAAAGQTRIEPLHRGDIVLYRVLVGAWPQAQGAAAARVQAVAMGFADARIVAR